jgi:hypothetical protein
LGCGTPEITRQGGVAAKCSERCRRRWTRYSCRPCRIS